ncbi:protein unc-13 homolog C-like [Coccinella septempunctata]|uniref:protein unc-13 homolog C-like n=1 Tax=Coccinella septempunctata TaxID=41139 RepID=UPI001D0740C5|nr:protein unc-13 homolog C-like [Coccinella septempunctata]XP_044752655.1 protein unc-13 homolog C-like [Coccinella septempunctata]
MPPKTTGDIKNAIKDSLRELLCDEEFIGNLLAKVEEKLATFQKTVDKHTDAIRILEEKMDKVQQNEKVNNICVYNLPEEQDRDTREIFIQLCKDKMNIKIPQENIATCYRVGKVSEKPRPVIIKFQQYAAKKLVLKNVYKLKGTKVGIAEDLTKNRLILYRSAQELTYKQSVFTRYGNIYVKINEKVHKIPDVKSMKNLIE